MKPIIKPLLTLIAALVKRPRTAPELVIITRLHKCVVWKHLNRMQAMEPPLVRIIGYPDRKLVNEQGPLPYLWEWCAKGDEDAVPEPKSDRAGEHVSGKRHARKCRDAGKLTCR